MIDLLRTAATKATRNSRYQSTSAHLGGVCVCVGGCIPCIHTHNKLQPLYPILTLTHYVVHSRVNALPAIHSVKRIHDHYESEIQVEAGDRRGDAVGAED